MAGLTGGRDTFPLTEVHFIVEGMSFDAVVAVNDYPGLDAILGMDISQLKKRLRLTPAEDPDLKSDHTEKGKKKRKRRARRPKRKCARSISYHVPNTSSDSEQDRPV